MFRFFLGVNTDTFDILGKIVNTNNSVDISKDVIEKTLMNYYGIFSQAYPPFSSKIIDGIPMFVHARRGTLKPTDIPRHPIEVKEVKLIGVEKIQKSDFKIDIISSIASVRGDFRQEEITRSWQTYFEENKRESFDIFTAKVSCSSGFYVRQLVSDIGCDVGTGAVTFSILRTKVGSYLVENSIR